MTRTGPVVFCKLLQNGALHDIKIGCIRLVWAGAKKYKFLFMLCAGTVRKKPKHALNKIYTRLDVRAIYYYYDIARSL